VRRKGFGQRLDVAHYRGSAIQLEVAAFCTFALRTGHLQLLRSKLRHYGCAWDATTRLLTDIKGQLDCARAARHSRVNRVQGWARSRPGKAKGQRANVLGPAIIVLVVVAPIIGSIIGSALATMVCHVQARAQFDHVCNVVLRRDGESLLKRALMQEGIDAVPALLTIADDTAPSLAFKDGGNTTLTVNRGDMALIRSFRKYAITRAASRATVEDEWLTMTAEDFDAFRVRSIGTPFGTPRGAVLGPRTESLTPQPPIDNDKCGVNRDYSAFPVSKKERCPLLLAAMARYDAQAQGKREKLQATHSGTSATTTSEANNAGTAESNTNGLEHGHNTSSTTVINITPSTPASLPPSPSESNGIAAPAAGTTVDSTTTGPTPRSLVAIGHHGANRDCGAFPAPRNKCWPGHTIPMSTLSPLASSPSKSNGIAVQAAGTDGHWPVHATASPMYRTQVSTTATRSVSPTSVVNDFGKEQLAPKVKMESAPNFQDGLVCEEARSIADTGMDTQASSAKDNVVPAGNATRAITLGFSTPPSTLAPSATSTILALPVFATPATTGSSKRSVTTAAPNVGTGLDHGTSLPMCGAQSVQAVLVAVESGTEPWKKRVMAPSTTVHCTATPLSPMVPSSCNSMVSMAITSTNVDGIPGLVTFPLPPSSSTVKDEWLAMAAEDFDAFHVRSADTSFGAPCNDVVGTTAAGSTSRPLVDIGHHGVKRDYSAFPAPNNERCNLLLLAVACHDAQAQTERGKQQATPCVAKSMTTSEVADTGVEESTINDLDQEYDAPSTALINTASTGPKLTPGDPCRILSNFGCATTRKLLTAYNLRAELVCGEAFDNDDTGSNDQDPHLFKKGVMQNIRSHREQESNQVTSTDSPTPVFTGAWIGGNHTGTDMHKACTAVTGIAVIDTGNGALGTANGGMNGHNSASGAWVGGNNTGMDMYGACIGIKKGQDAPFGANNSDIAPIDTGSTAGIGIVNASLRVTTDSSIGTCNVLPMSFLNSAKTGHGSAGIGTASAVICVATGSSIGTSGVPFMGPLDGAAAGRGNTIGSFIGGNHTDTFAFTNIGATGQDNAAGGWTSGNIPGTITHGVCTNTKRGQDASTGANNGSVAVNDSTISAAGIGFTLGKAPQVAPSGLHDSGNTSIDGAISITVLKAEHVAPIGTTYNGGSEDGRIDTTSGNAFWTGHRDFGNGRFGVTIEVTSHDDSQDALISAGFAGTSIAPTNGVAIGETNQCILAINGDSIGIAVTALIIPIGEETQVTLITVTDDDQVAQGDDIKSTPETEDDVWSWSDSTSKVPADKECAPLLNPYDLVERMHSSTLGKHTPHAIIPLHIPTMALNDKLTKATQPPMMKYMVEEPVLLDYGEHTCVVQAPSPSTILPIPDTPAKRAGQDEEEKMTPKVKMRTSASWFSMNSQAEHPTSNEWGVSTL
jgi:hypothetical protein